MYLISKIIPWKRTLYATLTILVALIVLSFYGLYTNMFYFFKIDNYIFPILSLVHFIFLYVLWFKIKESEISDPQMRNLEYSLYVVSFIYIFKLIDTLYVLSTYKEFESHQLPATFFPVGGLIIAFYILLLGLTLLSFYYRKKYVGAYNIDILNEQIDTWE
ncbi:hypothetical protein [Maribacter sp.]|uniref:hypothetical protein n=1 Tax=Maribacter sp. TaxID=1897614 RepID=UPI0025C0C29E|nr:hypothetical protein [Maribacter sp.]